MRNKIIILIATILIIIVTTSNYLLDKKLQKTLAYNNSMYNQITNLKNTKRNLDKKLQKIVNRITAERDQEISHLKIIITRQANFNSAQADAAIDAINEWKEKNKALQLKLRNMVAKNKSLTKKLQTQRKIIAKYDMILTSYKKEEELTRIATAQSASDKLFHATLLAWNEYRIYQPFQIEKADKKILKMLLVNFRFRNLNDYGSIWNKEALWYFENKYGVTFFKDPINVKDYVSKELKKFEKYLANNQQIRAGKIADELKAIFQNDDKLWKDFQPRLKSIKVGHGNLYDYLLSDYTTPSEIPTGLYFKNNNPWRVTQGN